MKVVNDRRLITKVCQMYYLEDISQKKIAEKLGLSPPTISRMILNGRKLGIVEIKINDNIGTEYVELERELEQKLGLKEALVVDSDENETEQEKLIAEAGAQLLEMVLDEDSIVGVSMGETLARLPEYINYKTNASDRNFDQVLFVPLIGGLGQMELGLHSNTVAQNLARSFGSENLFFHAPGRVEDLKTKKAFLKTPSVHEVLDIAKNMNIALLGIGYPNKNSRIITTGYYSPEEVEEIIRQKAAGDICLQAYDLKGSTQNFSAFNRVVGIELSDLKKIEKTIGFAGGINKAEAIIGAVRGGFINHLVTDKACAERILNKLEYNEEKK